ncbi:uncharacterized protein [Anolis sagrei]|uniref:uncharacterized protein isoform X3 n=1 Tax=Anolis sagrei TaxID=38937 RepID=UPI00352086DD
MAPKKNVGGPKGKGPAKKTSAKRPLPPSESSSGEDDVSAEDLNALMARMEKFERERGLSTREAGPRPARRASRKLIVKNLLSRMSVLEASHTAVRRDGEEPEQPEPSREEQGPTAPSVDQPQAARGQVAADQSAPSALTDAAPAISRPQLEIPEVRPETIATSSAAAPAYPVRASPSAAPAVSGSVSVGQPSVQASVVDGPSTSSDGAIQAAGTRRGRGSRTHAGPSLEGWSDETALGLSRLAHRRRVLVCGHSYVFWAGREALRTAYGQHLGLASTAAVEWRGRRGLRWDGLCPLLFNAGSVLPPDVLVIHLGGNDLGLLTGKALFLQARADIRKIWWTWPGVHIVWSAIIPRRRWLGGGDVGRLEKARKRVNRAMRVFMIHQRGHFLSHPNITRDDERLYRSDGIHLSELGNQLFLQNLQEGIRRVLEELVGDRGEIDICP